MSLNEDATGVYILYLRQHVVTQEGNVFLVKMCMVAKSHYNANNSIVWVCLYTIMPPQSITLLCSIVQLSHSETACLNGANIQQ